MSGFYPLVGPTGPPGARGAIGIGTPGPTGPGFTGPIGPTGPTGNPGTGYGGVTFTSSALDDTLTANTLFQITLSDPTIVDALQSPFTPDNLWSGSYLTAPDADDVLIVKVVATAAPLLTGGFLTCCIGPSMSPPFPNSSDEVYTSGVGDPQVFTFVFPILVQAAFAENGFIMLTSSVEATLTAIRLGIYPVSAP